MRAKLLVDRSQTFLMCLFVCGVYVISTNFSILYFFEKSKWFFEELWIFSRAEFSTGVEKFPDGKTEQGG